MQDRRGADDTFPLELRAVLADAELSALAACSSCPRCRRSLRPPRRVAHMLVGGSPFLVADGRCARRVMAHRYRAVRDLHAPRPAVLV